MNIFLIESKLWFQSSSLSDNKTFLFITHSTLLVSQIYQNKLKNIFSNHFFLGNFRKLAYFRWIVNIEVSFSGSWQRDYSSFWVKIVKERSGFIKMNKINRVNIRNVPIFLSSIHEPLTWLTTDPTTRNSDFRSQLVKNRFWNIGSMRHVKIWIPYLTSRHSTMDRFWR